jgi:hypothetical protein
MWQRVALWSWVAVTIALGLAMSLWTLPRIAEGAGGLVPFDLRFTGYSGDEARAFLAALTPVARDLYLGPQRVLDMIYPVMLSALLALALWRSTRGQAPALRMGLAAVAVAGGAVDQVENTIVARLLRDDADLATDGRVALASAATMTKSALTGVAVIAIVALSAMKFAARRRRR